VEGKGGLPEVLEDMHEILDHDDLDLVALGAGSDLAQQVFLPVGEHDPAHALVRITAQRFLKGLLDDHPLRGLDPRPSAFVLRSRSLTSGCCSGSRICSGVRG
jgi:hypothetical protein